MSECILVIDDNPLLLASLAEILTTDGATPILARTGADALQRVRGGMTPDVVVIDLDMRDAYGVLAQLGCAMENVIPVVAVSSTPRRLLGAGLADVVLMKPFDREQLRTCVDRAYGPPPGPW